MTAQQRYRNRIANEAFCIAGLAWAQGFPNLLKAWRACPRGSWMAWWLFDEFDVPRRALEACRPVGASTSIYTAEGWSPEQQLEFARNLRKAFTATGKPRSPKDGRAR